MAVQFTSKQFLKEMKKIKKKSLAMDNSNKNPMKAKYDIKFKKIFWQAKFQSNFYNFFSNIDKIKQDAIWNDENQRWRIPDLITQKTKLPPAGKFILRDLVNFSAKPKLVNSISRKNFRKTIQFSESNPKRSQLWFHEKVDNVEKQKNLSQQKLRKSNVFYQQS